MYVISYVKMIIFTLFTFEISKTPTKLIATNEGYFIPMSWLGIYSWKISLKIFLFFS